MMFFLIINIRYFPTLAASLGLGTVIADIIKFVRLDCAACNIVDIVPAPGIYLALMGSLAVVAATLLETSTEDERTAEENNDYGDETMPAEDGKIDEKNTEEYDESTQSKDEVIID